MQDKVIKNVFVYDFGLTKKRRFCDYLVKKNDKILF
jgi:hypothetical protein